MPCMDYSTSNYANSYNPNVKKLKARLDMMARIACKAMDELVKQGKADFLLLEDEEVRKWYEQHVEDDRKAKVAAEERRLKLEAARLEKERKAKIREEALSKLTAEERDILLEKTVRKTSWRSQK